MCYVTMLRIIIILGLLGVFEYQTCFGNTQTDDWKQQGFYRPRRNYPSQSQNENLPSYGQNYQNQNIYRSEFSHSSTGTSYSQDTERNPFGINHQNTQKQSPFGSNYQRQYSFGSGSQNSKSDAPRTNFGQNYNQNVFGNNNPNSHRRSSFEFKNHNSIGTGYSQKTESLNALGSASQNNFAANFGQNTQGTNIGPNLFRSTFSQPSYNAFKTNEPSVGSYNQNPQNSFGRGHNQKIQNSFGNNGQNIQAQNSFSSLQTQNAFSTFGSNYGIAKGHTYQGPNYLPPKRFMAPEYLPPKEVVTTTRRPFYTTTTKRPYTTTTRRPFYTTTKRYLYTTTTKRPSSTTTTTKRPTDDDNYEKLPDKMKVPIGAVSPAMAIPVPPEPEDDDGEIIDDFITTTNRPAVFPAMAMQVPPEEDDPTPSTTVTTTPSTTVSTTPPTTTPTTTEPEDDDGEIIDDFITTTNRPAVLPAMAMQVPPEEDDPTPSTTVNTTPSTTVSTTPPTTTSTTPSTTISTTPSTTTTTTTTTPSTTISTTPSTTTSTTPSTTIITTPPTTPSTTPSTTISTTPSTTTTTTTTTPSTTTSTTASTTTKTTTTTPSTTTPITSTPYITTSTTTTPDPNRYLIEETSPPTTPSTTTFKAPKYLPPNNTTRIPPTPPPAPAMASPVPPEPECDPLDPSTYPTEIDQRYFGDSPCGPTTSTVKPIYRGPLYLPPSSEDLCVQKSRVRRSTEDTLRLEDLKGTPRPVWYAGIYKKVTDPYFPICGGSIVREDIVISAAHCFWDDVGGKQAADLFAVAASKIYKPWKDPMDKKAQKSDVSAITIPPRYLGAKASFLEDIAILTLATPFKYTRGVRPICVDFDVGFDRQQLKAGHYGTFTGWGYTDSKGTPTQRLLWLELPYIEIEKCIRDSDESFLKYITSDKVCAGENDTGKALCRGDSGGGLAFWQGPASHATPYLRGVASTAPTDKNAACNVFAYGSFTWLYAHRTFLRDHVPDIEKCRFWE